MQKRHVVVGLVMILASTVSYQLVRTNRPQMTDSVVSAPALKVSTASPTTALNVPSAADEWDELVALSDAAMMLATGVALLGLAASVRRHTS